MKYREVRKLFRKAGWEAIRQNGSHEVWRSEGGETAIIAGSNSDDVSKGLLHVYLKQLGLK
jgi:predicted RNA binding protein YcfA (HicA-like mRNA interferase family)